MLQDGDSWAIIKWCLKDGQSPLRWIARYSRPSVLALGTRRAGIACGGSRTRTEIPVTAPVPQRDAPQHTAQAIMMRRIASPSPSSPCLISFVTFFVMRQGRACRSPRLRRDVVRRSCGNARRRPIGRCGNCATVALGRRGLAIPLSPSSLSCCCPGMGKAYPSANENELLPDHPFSHPLLFFL